MNARWFALLAAAAVAPEARAQQADTSMLVRPATTATLTLAEAVGQARLNNPAYRQVVNNADPADAAVKAAYGAFIPNVGASGGVNYAGAGSQFFGGQTFTQPSSYGSSYQLGFDWTLSGTTILGPSAAKASQRAAQADTSQGSLTLAEQVVTQYLNGLQAQATHEVQRAVRVVGGSVQHRLQARALPRGDGKHGAEGTRLPPVTSLSAIALRSIACQIA